MGKFSPKVIGLWTVPCTAATLLINAFKARLDTEVLSEPFSEGFNRSKDPAEVVANHLLALADKPIKFFQDMSFYADNKIPNFFYEKTVNVFIINNPQDLFSTIPSDAQSVYELGYKKQYELFQRLRYINTKSIVLDAHDLHHNTEATLSKFCRAANIEFFQQMIAKNSQKADMALGSGATSTQASGAILRAQIFYNELSKFKLTENSPGTDRKIIPAFYNAHQAHPNHITELKSKLDEAKDKCFFFDLDGTLCDNEELVALAHCDTIAFMSDKYDMSLQMPTVAAIKSISWGASINYVVNTLVSEHTQLTPYKDEYKKYALNRFNILKEKAAEGYFIKPSVDLLKYIVSKGHKVCIVSGTTRAEIEKTLDGLQLKGCVPYLGAQDYTRGKPNPEPYQLAKKMMKVGEHTLCIAFEDSPRGILSARAAGLWVVGLSMKNEDLFKFGANIVVSTLSTCQNILEELDVKESMKQAV